MEIITFALFLLIIYGIYGLAVFGAITALRKNNVLPSVRVAISFLLVGILAGLVGVSMWPRDVGVIFNFPAVLLGDKIYHWSIILLGDPSSPNAHFTIPWVFRVPQVYVISSIVAWGMLGLFVQLAHARISAFTRYRKSH